ncbi:MULTISPECIES: hypothetical protein [Bradyrhizobium]|uniref:DUF2510 domain-containing protein n=1 Tax=Bradyrhizobium vignae TaxID=1549949 RepID=A0A2U3PWV0_9BRAD|nr:hypothetical protein [Bradyrhizobium vignae]MBP0109518.1 hypothetical protein [Bradyrhizobium vignae]RXG84673.1 hypothetical protein EAV90_36595 [Bradyrhizobium vignae]SPP93642.1 conserved exported protein of unknown function [Bradyrhizobium vignae]
MKKTLVAALTVATVAGSLVTATPPAKAGDVGAGIAAGLIGGAIVGGAIASSRPAYGGPVYVAEPGPPPPPCYWRRERYWDGYGWVVRPVRVCY